MLFLVGLTLCDRPNREYWEDGRRAVCDLRAGETCLSDMKRNPTALLDKPYHTLVFYLPRAALDAIADDANAPRIHDLCYEPGAGVNDATISGLGSLLLPALAIQTKLTLCLSTTSCWQSGCMSLRHMAACGQCHGWPEVGSRHGRSGARENFFSPTSSAVWRSGRWRESAAYRWVISRTPSAAH